jgi:hypothetical protein
VASSRGGRSRIFSRLADIQLGATTRANGKMNAVTQEGGRTFYPSDETVHLTEE